MSNLSLLEKISSKNSQISFNDLFEVILNYPLANTRSLKNIRTVVEDESIKKFTNAKDLIMYIEKCSRLLDCKSANLKKAEIENQVREFEELKKRDNEVFIKILESQGLSEKSQNLECAGCGLVVSANGRCKC